ncbi:MAG: hypothetical protein [Caudoviricetes sp.]|nr:MAG: hypothetical protein [Caudoviricetes sp.]
MKVHTVDVKTTLESMATTILADDGYLRVLEVDGKIAGGMWGFLTNMPWSKVKVATDIILFVKKEYRGYGLSLVDDWVSWAEAKGASEVIISTASGIKPESFSRLVQRKGFSLQGHTFSKEIINVE